MDVGIGDGYFLLVICMGDGELFSTKESQKHLIAGSLLSRPQRNEPSKERSRVSQAVLDQGAKRSTGSDQTKKVRPSDTDKDKELALWTSHRRVTSDLVGKLFVPNLHHVQSSWDDSPPRSSGPRSLVGKRLQKGSFHPM